MSTDPKIPAMAAAALQLYGKRLDSHQQQLLIKTAQQLEDAANDLRLWELLNGDEPDFTFSALDGQDW